MELLKRSMILAAVFAIGTGLAACQTSGEVGASGEVKTDNGAGVGGSVGGGASGSVDTPKSDSSTPSNASGATSGTQTKSY